MFTCGRQILSLNKSTQNCTISLCILSLIVLCLFYSCKTTSPRNMSCTTILQFSTGACKNQNLVLDQAHFWDTSWFWFVLPLKNEKCWTNPMNNINCQSYADVLSVDRIRSDPLQIRTQVGQITQKAIRARPMWLSFFIFLYQYLF